MVAFSLILAALGYVAFYAAAPGRQSQPLGPPKPLRLAGVGLTGSALVLSAVGTGTAGGPVYVVTVMMAVASALAMVGPLLLPQTEAARSRTPRPGASARTPSRPSTLPPAD